MAYLAASNISLLLTLNVTDFARYPRITAVHPNNV